MGKVYRECEKQEKCKHGRNCPYDNYPLSSFLCFDSNRYDKTKETELHRARKRGKANSINVYDQIYIAINDYCDGRGKRAELAKKAGVTPKAIERILKDEFPAGFESVVAIAEAAGYKLEVAPIDGSGKELDP